MLPFVDEKMSEIRPNQSMIFHSSGSLKCTTDLEIKKKNDIFIESMRRRTKEINTFTSNTHVLIERREISFAISLSSHDHYKGISLERKVGRNMCFV